MPQNLDEELKNAKFDMKSLRDTKIPWKTRFFLRFWPMIGIRLLAEDFKMSNELSNPAHKLFQRVGRVDIAPSGSGERGFQLILNGNTALYFYQEEDHFIYDGFEIGDYEKGEVTIFDK